MRRTWDFVSLFTYAILAYPAMRLAETFDTVYFRILIAMLIGGLLLKATRHLPVWREWQLRPAGACDCSILNDGGSYEGKIGMPSGHVFMAAMTIALLWIANPRAWTIALGAAAVAAVAVARVAKGCHTLEQVAAGAAVGVAAAIVLSKLVGL